MNFKSPQASRVYAEAAEATGAPVGVMMNNTLVDLLITALIGGILLLLASTVGLI